MILMVIYLDNLLLAPAAGSIRAKLIHCFIISWTFDLNAKLWVYICC